MLEFIASHRDMLIQTSLEHLFLVLSSLMLSAVIAVPLGIMSARTRFANLLLAVLGTAYTIPSLALFALLVPITRLGPVTAIIALTLYGTMTLTRAVVLGLENVAPDVLECATALGMSRRGRMLKIELPLAAPLIIVGLRTTTIILISSATIGAWIAAGGLGTLLFDGIRQDDGRRIIAGSILLSCFAITIQTIFGKFENHT